MRCNTTASRGGSSGRGDRAPLRRLSREAPPCRDPTLDRGQVPQDREEHEDPFERLERDRGDPPDHRPGRRDKELKERAEEEEDQPVRASEEARVATPLAHGLCLRAHVRRQEDAQKGQRPYGVRSPLKGITAAASLEGPAVPVVVLLDRIGTFIEPLELPLERNVPGKHRTDTMGGGRHGLILPNRHRAASFRSGSPGERAGWVSTGPPLSSVRSPRSRSRIP